MREVVNGCNWSKDQIVQAVQAGKVVVTSWGSAKGFFGLVDGKVCFFFTSRRFGDQDPKYRQVCLDEISMFERTLCLRESVTQSLTKLVEIHADRAKAVYGVEVVCLLDIPPHLV